MPAVPDRAMQELLAQRDFVRLLARQLLGEGQADDLAQKTWVRALRLRTEVQQPRRWVARVVRNLAATWRRDQRRRQRREHDAAQPERIEGPSPAEILACEEVRQRVVAAVLALEQPFRATVLASFYECLDHAAIAARHGVPVATVRSRLKRGLDKLRARLDAEHGGERAAWAAPLALLGKGSSKIAFPILGALMSTSNKVALAACLLLLAALTLWMSLPGAAAPAPLDSSPLARGAAAAAATDVEQKAEPNRRVAIGLADGGSNMAKMAASLPFPMVDEPIDPVAVRVMDDATRQPVGGATLLYQPFRVDYFHARAFGDRELQEANYSTAFLERYGSRTTTAADGTATVQLPRTGGRVLASRGDRVADLHIEPQELMSGERATIWLQDPRWIRLRVVDAASRAPMPGILIDVSSSGTGPVVPESCGYGMLSGPSDEHGLVLMPWRRDQESLRVRPWIVGPGAWTSLELPAALDQVTELRCTATGSLTVELRTPSGRLWPTDIHATVEAVGGGRSPEYGPITWSRADPGIYRIAHVGIGLSLEVRAYPDWPDNDAGFFGMAAVAGPLRAGEDVRVVLTTKAEPCVLQAKLQCAGAPLPAGSRVSILHGNGIERRVEADGRVAWTVRAGQPAKGRIVLQDPMRGSSRLACLWQLDESATPGVHDLGTLTLVEPPRVVSGEIDVGSQAWSGPPVQVLVEAPDDHGGWGWLQKIDVDPAASPAFEVRAETAAERVRVTVLPARHFAAPEPSIVAVGTRGLRLHLAPGLPLVARVLAPPAYAQAIRCVVRSEDGAPLVPVAQQDDEPPRSEAVQVDFDGAAAKYLWPSLPAGSYRVEVIAPGVDEPLAVVPAVRVQPGAAADPRLDPIDVRTRARTVTVSVVPLPDGPQPITDGGVAMRPAGQAGNFEGLLFDSRGQARLLAGPGPVDLLVAIPGHRLWHAKGVTDASVEVALEPCLQVPFRLAPRVAERLAGYRVKVQLAPREVDAEARSPTVVFRRFGERRPAAQPSLTWMQRLAGTGEGTVEVAATAAGRIPVSASGTFEVGVCVQGAKRTAWLTSGNGLYRNQVTPERIVVRGADDPEFVIDARPEAIDRVLEQLAERR